MISLSLQAFRSVIAIAFLFQAALPVISRIGSTQCEIFVFAAFREAGLVYHKINDFCLNLAPSGWGGDR
jgi:hypothetical protein